MENTRTLVDRAARFGLYHLCGVTSLIFLDTSIWNRGCRPSLLSAFWYTQIPGFLLTLLYSNEMIEHLPNVRIAHDLFWAASYLNAITINSIFYAVVFYFFLRMRGCEIDRIDRP